MDEVQLCVCHHAVAAHDLVPWAVPPRESCRQCKEDGRVRPCERFQPIARTSTHHYRRGMTTLPRQVIFLPNGCRVLFELHGTLMVPTKVKTHALLAEVTGGHSVGKGEWVVETDIGRLIPLARRTTVLTVGKGLVR
jgi:hypothetical protein